MVDTPGTAPLTDGAGVTPLGLLPGQRIAGRYELRAELGRGGFGIVYDAWDHDLKRPVALKLRRADRTDPISERRFRSEAALARDVVHPNLVRAFDLGVEGELLYLVLEKVDGAPLSARIEQSGPLPIDETLRLADALLEALGALHAAGIVHRDVKPSNILLLTAPDGHAEIDDLKLGDLGVARKLDTGDTRLTLDSTFVGTLAYLPPEIVRGEEATFQSDLYSLGMTIAEALLGQLPGDATSTLANVLARRRSPLSAAELLARRPETPPWLADWVERLLEPDLARRYDSATAALADLRAHRSPARRRRTLRWVAIGAAVALAGVVAWLAVRSAPPDFQGLRIEAGEVIAYGPGGERLWTVADAQTRMSAITDVPLVRFDHRGGRALAVIRYRQWSVGSDGTIPMELLDPATGATVRRVDLGEALRAFPLFSASYVPRIEAIDLDEDGIDEVLIFLNHLPSWPSIVMLYEPAVDRVRALFVGAGHQAPLAAAVDLDGDGRRELLLPGWSSILRRTRTLTAVRVVPWIGEGVVVPTLGLAASQELRPSEGPTLAWQVLLGRQGIQQLTVDEAADLLHLRLEDGRRRDLRFDGSDRTGLPATDAQAGRREAAYASLREVLRLLDVAEWQLAADEAVRAETLAREADEPLLAQMAARFAAGARIRSGDLPTGLDRFVALRTAEPDYASDIAFDAGEALHLAGHLAPAGEWFRRSSLEGGAVHLGKDRKDALLAEVTAAVELGRPADARAAIAWYRTAYGWEDDHPVVSLMRTYVDWRAGDGGARIPPIDLPDLGFGWEWSLLALEFQLAAGAPPAAILAELEQLEPLVTEGRGLYMLLHAELLARLDRSAEARTLAVAAERFLDSEHEVLDYALRDLASERIARLGGN